MQITLKTAKLISRLLEGEILTSSEAKNSLFKSLVLEGILSQNGKIQKKIRLVDKNGLHIYLKNQYQINNITNYITVLEKAEISRSELVHTAGNSKLKSIRTFKGFLVNSYFPLDCTLNNQKYILEPKEGTFDFIYDFENFIPPANSIIIGVENPANFRFIHQQKYLFDTITPLFVSRYPQNQSKDLIKWLQSIPNHYLHFGDFDFAGIGIYINEYKKYLKNKSSFFIPSTIENIIKEYGNRDLYDIQRINFDVEKVELNLKNLIQLIHTYKKGLEQEYFIKSSSK